MNPVATYHVAEQLRDGRSITIRAIRPDDKKRLLEAFRGLEESTIRSRFFGPRKSPSAQELAWATEIDFVHHAALVASLEDRANERIIGVGRYVRVESASSPLVAEVAFVVEEDFQGQGIASILLRHLAAIAHSAGVAALEADVLPANAAMLRVFERSGLPITVKRSTDSVHVKLDLSSPGQKM